MAPAADQDWQLVNSQSQARLNGTVKSSPETTWHLESMGGPGHRFQHTDHRLAAAD
jgi:hypothetical protein